MSEITAFFTALIMSITSLFGMGGGIGAVSFPTSLDTFVNPGATDSTATVSHSGQHSDANDAIEALQAKVGVSSSTVQSSLAFKLKDIFGGNKAASISGTETLTNKTLTSPTINTGTLATSTFTGSSTFTLNGGGFSIDFGSDATGDVFYRNASGDFTRLGIGAVDQVLKVSGGVPVWGADSTSGGVKMRAVASTTKALGTSPSKILWQDDFDTGDDHATGTYTTPAAGEYLISSRIATNGVRSINMFIYVNGAASSTANYLDTGALEDYYISDMLSLQSGDTVEIWADYDGGATTVNVESGTTTSYFSVIQL
jgi:hypothetical protein